MHIQHKHYLIAFAISSPLILAGCFHQQPLPKDTSMLTNTAAEDETIVEDGITDSMLALALLTSEDIGDTLENIRPATIELNDQLDKDYLENYLFFVGRRWYGREEGTEMVMNAITKYTNATRAQNETQRLAEEFPLLNGETFGDVTYIAYDDPLLYYGSPSDPAQLTYRFTYGAYSAKIQVVDPGSPLDDPSEIQARLLEIATPLAERQYEKLVDFLGAPTTELPTNVAIKRLPAELDGLALIGTIAVTAEEWLGVTFDLTSETIDGFVSGGMSRLSIDAQPDYVAEITMLEFASTEQAQGYQATFLTSGAAETGTEFSLPESIDAFSDGMTQETLAEVQGVVDTFVVDITVFGPFVETDVDFAKEQATAIAENVLTTF